MTETGMSEIHATTDRHELDHEDASPRMACALCRRRKLRCDRQLPCDSCVRLGFECSYDAPRSTQTIKRQTSERVERTGGTSRIAPNRNAGTVRPRSVAKKLLQGDSSIDDWTVEQMTQEDMAELEGNYFRTMNQSIPILHQSRYILGTIAEPRLRPPNYLRYIVCALSACVANRSPAMHTVLYRLARKLLEETEYHDGTSHSTSIAGPQAWILISIYELLQMHFQRWWMSTARAVRLTQIMGLHCVDAQPASRRVMPPAKDWIELEEQRRAFWMSFCLDRYAAFGHGCPMIIDEKDIQCRLPVSEEAYQAGIEEHAITLHEALNMPDRSLLTVAATVVTLTSETGHKLKLLRQNDFGSAGQTAPADIWHKINFLDDTLHYAFMVPPHLAASGFVHTPILTFLHMSAPTSTIALHQTAEEQASANGITPSSLPESQAIRLAAAEMVVSTMRLASHIDVRHLHPLTGVCLSTAAGVFMRSLAVRMDDAQQTSLQTLLEAMSKLQAINPLTGGYFKDLDMKFPGMRELVCRGTQIASPQTPLTLSRNDSGDFQQNSVSSSMSRDSSHAASSLTNQSTERKEEFMHSPTRISQEVQPEGTWQQDVGMPTAYNTINSQTTYNSQHLIHSPNHVFTTIDGRYLAGSPREVSYNAQMNYKQEAAMPFVNGYALFDKRAFAAQVGPPQVQASGIPQPQWNLQRDDRLRFAMEQGQNPEPGGQMTADTPVYYPNNAFYPP